MSFTEVTDGANYDAADPRFGVKTFATLEGNEWVINGEKHYTTNSTGWDGKNCHLYAVVCRTDPSKNAKADKKMKIEACRYLTWKSCQQ